MQINDLDAIQMIWVLRRMRDEGRYLDGREIRKSTDVLPGCGGFAILVK